MVGHSGNRRSGALGSSALLREGSHVQGVVSTHRALVGFRGRHITFEAESETSGTFNSRLLVPGEATSGPPLTSFDGRWLVSDGLILTAISVQ